MACGIGIAGTGLDELLEDDDAFEGEEPRDMLDME